jgi:uncharacterized protein with HEPN domain
MAARPISADERLLDIVKWGDAPARHIEGFDLDRFLADEKTQHATIKCTEAIGEAAKKILKIDPGFDARYPT